MSAGSADAWIEALGLEPHPEGGHYVETWRHDPGDGSRGAGTAIYFLLRRGEESAWHRVLDADEIWHFYAGSPLQLGMAREGEAEAVRVLGPDLGAGQRPQLRVPAGVWQRAHSLGDYTLVGCTVSPAFEFAGFELDPDFSPGS